MTLTTTPILDDARARDAKAVGAKAANLAKLRDAGLPVPPFIVLTDDDAAAPEDLRPHLATLTRDGRSLAVRSSSLEEDDVTATFAGLLESFLDVDPADVPACIARVRRSALSPRVRAYRRDRGLADAPSPCPVIVQAMLRPEVSGVAFGADPVTADADRCVISAVAGTAAALVDGAVDGQTWRLNARGDLIDADHVGKGETALVSLAQLRAIQSLTHRAGDLLGGPQDVEWAIEAGTLYIVQARPITTTAPAPCPSPDTAASQPARGADGPRRVWDNANISESYGGVTTPLTFTFARNAYAGVYRAFCRLMGVPRDRIDVNADLFTRMLGFYRGRVYYNLYNWYRLIALLPGYRSNRRFMEQMMGVSESMPDEIVDDLAASGRQGRWGDRLRLLASAGRLVLRYLTLDRMARRFHARVDATLAPSADNLERLSLEELAAEYRRLERALLHRWDAPLANDFFTMISVGLLRSTVQRWLPGRGGRVVNDMLHGTAGMISIEPARHINRMATMAQQVDGAAQIFCEADRAAVADLLAQHPELRAAVDDYIARFGDRCMDELKLESPTLHEDPSPLWRAIGRAAGQRGEGDDRNLDPPKNTSSASRAAVGAHPLRRLILSGLTRAARRHLVLRENLRFERTRVFGRVRRIVVQMGERLAAEGQLDQPDDVFYLELEELLGFIQQDADVDLRCRAASRRDTFARHAAAPAPPPRFETRGQEDLSDDTTPLVTDDAPTADVLEGTGCCAGVVCAPVHRVEDPQRAKPRPGHILLAERTDPGWVMLFPGAAGVLVQRGSILSHSATLAREMGIPTVVGIPGLMDAIQDGDWVEMNGAAGTVRVVEGDPSAPNRSRNAG